DILLVLKFTSFTQNNFHNRSFTSSCYLPKELIAWNIFLDVWKKGIFCYDYVSYHLNSIHQKYIKIHLNSGSYRCCAKQIKFYCIRHYYKSCKKYPDEYGVPSIIPNFQISQNYSRSSMSETSTSDNKETYPNTSPSGLPTFNCNLCQKSNFTRQHLLDYCNSNHLFQIVPVTCPLCISLSWADPSQITRIFFSYLNQRHQCDYREFVNLQQGEETHYQTAVESLQVNI
uniref:RING-type E3 ubiquitin transferase n=1 Tax=Felis catus TaxID=9685 RepID=A0ABI7Y2E9_FELCA